MRYAGLEDVRLISRVHAGATVDDAQLDAVAERLYFHADPAACGREANGILEQIVQHARDQLAICVQREFRRVGLEAQLERRRYQRRPVTRRTRNRHCVAAIAAAAFIRKRHAHHCLHLARALGQHSQIVLRPRAAADLHFQQLHAAVNQLYGHFQIVEHLH